MLLEHRWGLGVKQELHHEIVRQAVHRLFAEQPAVAAKFGVTEAELFLQLDHGQAIADSPLGPTWLPAVLVPWAQAEHAMASPNGTGNQTRDIVERFGNQALDKVKEFMTDKVAEARFWNANEVANPQAQYFEFITLGAALHCLMDSYSGDHMNRDYSNGFSIDAPVVGIHTFGWLIGTHTPKLDELDQMAFVDGRLERASDRVVAVEAIVRFLETYLADRESNGPPIATTNFIGQTFLGGNVQLFAHPTGVGFKEQQDLANSREVCANNPLSPPPEFYQSPPASGFLGSFVPISHEAIETLDSFAMHFASAVVDLNSSDPAWVSSDLLDSLAGASAELVHDGGPATNLPSDIEPALCQVLPDQSSAVNSPRDDAGSDVGLGPVAPETIPDISFPGSDAPFQRAPDPGPVADP